MQEEGKVIAIEGDNVKIELSRTTNCSHCGACFCSPMGDKMTLTTKSTADIKEGDFVRLTLNKGVLLESAIYIYLIPILGLFTGVVLGQLFINSPLYIGGLGFLGLGIGLFITIILEKQFRNSPKFQVKIVEVIR